MRLFRDILTDEAGNFVPLDDADPKADDQQQTADEGTPLDETQPAATEAAPAGPEEDQQVMDEAKDWDKTRQRFVLDIIDLASGGAQGDLQRRRFSTVLRAQLRRLGTDAFKDGLEDGGVDPEDIDDRDRKAILAYLGEQGQYIKGFADDIFKDGLSIEAIQNRAELWANKSLRGFYQLGLASAGWNAVFEWQLGKTEQHCSDCARLHGQRHRMRDWRTKEWLPGSRKLSCGGWRCDCSFQPTKDKSRGRF